MSEISTVTNKAEQTLLKLTRASKPPPLTPPSLHNYDSHTRVLAKAEKILLTQNIKIKHMNSLHIDLEDTVNRQREAITTLTRTVNRIDWLTKDNGNLECRLKILESLTAENIYQAPPGIVINTNSANQHTTSSLIPPTTIRAHPLGKINRENRQYLNSGHHALLQGIIPTISYMPPTPRHHVIIKILIQKIIIEINQRTRNTLPCVTAREAPKTQVPSKIMTVDGPRRSH